MRYSDILTTDLDAERQQDIPPTTGYSQQQDIPPSPTTSPTTYPPGYQDVPITNPPGYQDAPAQNPPGWQDAPAQIPIILHCTPPVHVHYTPPALTRCTPPTLCSEQPTCLPPPDIKFMFSDSDSTDTSSPDIMCRICRCEPGSEKIISPCNCAGSLQYVHQSCLLKWIKAYDCVNKHHCELCQYEFKLKPRPWMEWRMPRLSITEQRRATCLVVICILAILIVIWSINDLIQNIEVSRIYMNWGFWTKLLFIVFGMFILAFQYPTFKYFYVKLRESNQIVLWGEEGEEQELLECGKLKRAGSIDK